MPSEECELRNFPTPEFRRIHLPRTPVNKGWKKEAKVNLGLLPFGIASYEDAFIFWSIRLIRLSRFLLRLSYAFTSPISSTERTSRCSVTSSTLSSS